ncbi:hypothetical protein K439DRAFT_1618474 [Ramaria rubella]|nr:hypothetical protein K439DRAFT_1618474 [Ramaria rubella]
MPPNFRGTLCMIEYSPEGVLPAICGLGDNTLQLEDVDVWVWLKLIRPKKDSLVFLQKLMELFTVRGQWADLAGTCWQQDLPMLLSTSVEKAFDWKHPHVETLLRVDPARALVNIEPYFMRKQRFWGSPRMSDDNSSLDGRGGGPPHSQACTDVPLTGPPMPSAPPPTSAHTAEDNPMEVNPADSLYYDIEVAVQSSSTAPVTIYADPPSA